jgi:hypothetical protein
LIYQGNSRDIDTILDDLRHDFKGDDYNIIQKNCNSFSDAFVMKLLNVPIPSYINRLANIGSFFSCLLPPSLTNQDAPVSSTNGRDYKVSANNVKAFSGQGYKLGSA